MAEILVTGAAGFLGRHLCTALIDGAHRVLAAAAAGSEGMPKDAVPVVVDACNSEGFARAVRCLRPQLVVHAAFRNRKEANQTDLEYLRDLQAVDIPLFEACALTGASLLSVGSSAVYGSAEGRDLIDEDCPIRPVSVYGLAKAMQEMTAQYEVIARALPLVIVRLFNLIGPGQSTGMVVPDWVSRAVHIARGAEPVLRVANRAAARDFVDVRDAAQAIRLLVEDFRPGTVINVASGTTVSLTEISDALIALCPRPFAVQETAPVLSATDVRIQCGDYARLKKGWGWQPQITWRQSLSDVWQEHWARGK